VTQVGGALPEQLQEHVSSSQPPPAAGAGEWFALQTANPRSVSIPILAAVLNKRAFPIPEKIYRRL
jgi:hypothetical protein